MNFPVTIFLQQIKMIPKNVHRSKVCRLQPWTNDHYIQSLMFKISVTKINKNKRKKEKRKKKKQRKNGKKKWTEY
jgi:hypothetical protein